MPQAYAEARDGFAEAAEQGDAWAQLNLGAMYDLGEGVPRDYVQAYMWLNLAASAVSGSDQQTYSSARDLVARKMIPAQIEEAQRLAREWKPKVSPLR